MFFRTSFLIAIFATVFTIISQSSSGAFLFASFSISEWILILRFAVYASPAPGLRPFLHAFDVETSGIASSDNIAPTASASATAVEVIDAAASSSPPEASPTPDSSVRTSFHLFVCYCMLMKYSIE